MKTCLLASITYITSITYIRLFLRQPKHILHRVKTWRTLRQPSSTRQRTSRKSHAIACAMSELDTFSHPSERNSVIADHIASSEDAESNRAASPCDRRSMPIMLGDFIQGYISAGGGRST